MKSQRFISSVFFLSVMVSISVVPSFFPLEAAGPKGTVYHFTVPKQLNMLKDANYYCWLPESVATLRCIIVHQHGCTREGDAPSMMNDLQWLTLAKKWHAAFIAPSLYTDVPGTSAHCNNWNDINNGSGNTFLAVLDTLARRSSHTEILTIPWALWGHSGGSMWATGMLGKYPDRVAVVIAEACGTDVSGVAAALKVPVLHHNGIQDLCYNDVYFANGRKKGALWAHAINPNIIWVSNPSNQPPTVQGHAPRDLRMIAIPWIDLSLTSRLPAQVGGSQLRDMDTSNAWLGDTGTRVIASAATFTGNKLIACWFPNQYFAKLWKEYMANGTIKDSTLPPAPYNLTGTYATRQMRLNWDADADLETGIKTFIIYRNGSVLQTLQWPNAPATLFTTVKGFQRWEDGDQPDPSPAPNMTFTDANVTDTGTYSYQVTTVNWSDVEGARSNTLTLRRGLVTGTRMYAAAMHTAQQSPISLRLNLSAGARGPLLSPGVFDIYDIKGRLITTVEVRSAGERDLGRLVGDRAGNVIVLRNKGLR
jgi:hypothetical protein